MRQLSYQPARGVAGELGVGIKRQDKADSFRKLAADDNKARINCTAEQAVQLMELAALAFPAHPLVLLRVPLPRAVQQQEPVGAVAQIEAQNSVQSDVQEIRIGWCMFRAGISPVGQKGKIKLSVGVRQESELQAGQSVLRCRHARSEATERRPACEIPLARHRATPGPE